MFALFASQKQASISCDLKGIQPIQPSLMHNAARNQRSLRQGVLFSMRIKPFNMGGLGYFKKSRALPGSLFDIAPFVPLPVPLPSQTGALFEADGLLLLRQSKTAFHSILGLLGLDICGGQKLPLLAALMRFEYRPHKACRSFLCDSTRQAQPWGARLALIHHFSMFQTCGSCPWKFVDFETAWRQYAVQISWDLLWWSCASWGNRISSGQCHSETIPRR